MKPTYIRFAVLTTIFLAMSSLFLVYVKYMDDKMQQQYDSQFTVKGGAKKRMRYTAEEVKEMIMALKQYQGDSLIIYKDGSLKSSNIEIQSLLNNFYKDPALMQNAKIKALQEEAPLALVLYKQATNYYLANSGSKK